MSKINKYMAFNTESKRMFVWEELIEFWTFDDIDRINNRNSNTILLQFTGLRDATKWEQLTEKE